MKTTQTKKEKEATKKENEDIAKATNLIVELMHLNENIDDNLWCSALFALYSHISRANGLSFLEYKQHTYIAMAHYKKIFYQDA